MDYLRYCFETIFAKCSVVLYTKFLLKNKLHKNNLRFMFSFVGVYYYRFFDKTTILCNTKQILLNFRHKAIAEVPAGDVSLK